MAALNIARQLELHVVAQVIESQLVVRAVGDIGGVGRLALGVAQVVLDDAHAEAQETVDAAHPLAIALGKIVIHGDDVNALALERVQVRRQGGNERLSLAGLHLGDHSAVQGDAANELNVEVTHVQRSAARLPHDGESLR
jgi:hypothetical protein